MKCPYNSLCDCPMTIGLLCTHCDTNPMRTTVQVEVTTLENRNESLRIERYDEGDEYGSGMYPHEDGQWVKYEDMVELLKIIEMESRGK